MRDPELSSVLPSMKYSKAFAGFQEEGEAAETQWPANWLAHSCNLKKPKEDGLTEQFAACHAFKHGTFSFSCYLSLSAQLALRHLHGRWNVYLKSSDPLWRIYACTQ